MHAKFKRRSSLRHLLLKRHLEAPGGLCASVCGLQVGACKLAFTKRLTCTSLCRVMSSSGGGSCAGGQVGKRVCVHVEREKDMQRGSSYTGWSSPGRQTEPTPARSRPSRQDQVATKPRTCKSLRMYLWEAHTPRQQGPSGRLVLCIAKFMVLEILWRKTSY